MARILCPAATASLSLCRQLPPPPLHCRFAGNFRRHRFTVALPATSSGAAAPAGDRKSGLASGSAAAERVSGPPSGRAGLHAGMLSGGAGRGAARLCGTSPARARHGLAALSRAKGTDSRSGAGAAADGAVLSCGLRRRERHVDVFMHALPARHFVHGVVPPHLPRAGARGLWVRRAAPGSSAGGREEGGGAWVPGARSTLAMSRARGGFASP